MNFNRLIITPVVVVFVISCGSQSRVITTKKERDKYEKKEVKVVYSDDKDNASLPVKAETEPEVSVSTPGTTSPVKNVEKYINTYKAIAKDEMRKYGIPASITLAQGILESGVGTSELSVKANNHFGIKCHNEWQGERAYRTGNTECFRKYDNPRASFKDHSLFLQRPHYQFLFSLPKSDYKSWAKGLKAAGYATDNKYPEKLINIIERYQLYTYDKEVLKQEMQEPAIVKTASEPEETTPAATNYADPVVKYIDLYKAVAKYEMKEHGIPASITLAQGILESGAGASEIAVRAKNHFGIKCNSEWQGAKFYRDDQCFRKYDNPRASFKDHSLFLQRPHYRFLFSLPKSDYKAWAKGLKAAGYATDIKYPEKLINIIERYQLYTYDKEVLKQEMQEPTIVKTASEPKETTPAATNYADPVVKYIDLYKAVAKYEMKEHGIPASITLAQGILESGAGASEIAVRAKNHFGIKCNSEWQGAKFYRDDQCFRKYDNPRASFKDHSLFLQRPHYQFLFSLPKSDYKSWAKGLKAAGYATDRKYPEKLINIIERYQLYKYDAEVLAGGSQEPVKVTTPSETRKDIYVVKEGDTLYSIAKKYGLTVEALMRINSLSSSVISVGQSLKVRPPN